MILSDKDLRKAIAESKIKIAPFNLELIGPSGIDIRLGHEAYIFKDPEEIKIINPFENHENITQKLPIKEGRLIIPPGEIVLATSVERIEVPEDHCARLIPKNSFNRVGIFLFSGTIEPGFKGNLTLTIQNLSKVPVILYPGMSFCKLAFEKMTSAAEEPYYQKKNRFQEKKAVAS